ncbi:hypothetical protein RE0346_20390 [Prescottella equi]|nr:hypothetical protein RE0346_20390 [Prescottella equi]
MDGAATVDPEAVVVVAEAAAVVLEEVVSDESSELHAVIPRAATSTPAATRDLRMNTVGPFGSGARSGATGL